MIEGRATEHIDKSFSDSCQEGVTEWLLPDRTGSKYSRAGSHWNFDSRCGKKGKAKVSFILNRY